MFVLCISLFSLRVFAQNPVSGEPLPSAPAKSTSSPTPANSNVKLGVGDLIEISVFGLPDLSTKTRISGSGDVYLPLVDYVHIANLTTDEAQGLIQKRLEDGGYVRAPHVSILVDESASQGVTLIGEVARPGTYPAIGDRRLYDLLSAAGGLTDKAGRSVTIEHRGNEHRGDPERVQVQLSANLAEDPHNNVDVFPGDTIIVSRAGIIYVVGDVQRPSGFLIEDSSVTVLKALALAGGNTRTSALSNSRILRQSPTGVQEIHVNLKKMLYAKTPDIALVTGDVLFIPGSATKVAAYRSADAAISMSAALAVVAIH